MEKYHYHPRWEGWSKVIHHLVTNCSARSVKHLYGYITAHRDLFIFTPVPMQELRQSKGKLYMRTYPLLASDRSPES